MPIYAYRCAACQHQQDILQKLSDEPLSICTACGATAFSKQLTAPGFHLKGSGWYATDFKGGTAASASKTDSATTASTEATPSASTGHACGSGGCGSCT